MIHWPAIIHFHGDAELIYVADQATWENDPHLQGQPYRSEDRLIDAVGNGFALVKNDGKVILQPAGITYSLD